MVAIFASSGRQLPTVTYLRVSKYLHYGLHLPPILEALHSSVSGLRLVLENLAKLTTHGFFTILVPKGPPLWTRPGTSNKHNLPLFFVIPFQENPRWICHGVIYS